jgi:hypothetical protein
VFDPDDHTAQRPTDTLQVGPTRPPLSEKVPARWRRRPTLTFLAFASGVAAGVGGVLWWQARPEPPPFRPDEHAVELILFEAVPPTTHPSGRASRDAPLHVDSAILLSGLVTSTVVGIDTPGDGLGVRAPALPLTVSPTRRLQSLDLTIVVRDCRAAARWKSADRPFTITWRDEFDRVHMDRAGDFDRSMARSLTSYVDAVCGNPLDGP